jgi:ribosomal protein L9
MLDFIKNAVNTLAGPMSTVVDLAGDALGLPPLLTNTIKAAAGAVSGNVMMAASGALGVMSELTRNPPAHTEFHPSSDPARAQEGYAPATQPGSGRAQAGASSAQAGSLAASTGYLEPRVVEYRDSLRTLAANYGLLDTLCGSKDGKINAHTLEVAASHPSLSPELRKSARFLLEHPEYRNMLDTAGKGGRVDGTISQQDVQQALKKVNEDIARHGVRQPSTPGPSTPGPCTPPAGQSPAGQSPPPVVTSPGSPSPTTPAPGSGGSCGHSGGVSDIINNPNMSMEEKLQAILMLISRDTDDEILDVMQQMASLRDERATLGSGEKDRARAAKLETSMEQLNLSLQKLMEKRKQMFDLMSNISSKFNEMAKVAIQNLGRA